MRFASFDIEISKELDVNRQISEQGLLGISIAAVAFEPLDLFVVDPAVVTWESSPDVSAMTTHQAQIVVRELMDAVFRGYTLLTWNGVAFDFRVLADESAMYSECARLALNHVDMMWMVSHKTHYFLGLDKAMIGAGLPSKLHRVTLNDGTVIENMSGEKAPRMWEEGERSAVRAYITQDVVGPIALARKINETHTVHWTSNSGTRMRQIVGPLVTFAQLLKTPRPPKAKWISRPAGLVEACSWMPAYILKEFTDV